MGRLVAAGRVPGDGAEVLRRPPAPALPRGRRSDPPAHDPRHQRRGDPRHPGRLERRPLFRGPGDQAGRRRPGERAGRRGLHRFLVGEGARWGRPYDDRAVHLQRGARARERAARRRHGRDVPRLAADGLRQRGAEGEVHAADRRRADCLGAGLLRARQRLGPRLAAVPRRPRRRRVRAQRPKAVLAAADLGRDVHARPHGPRGAEAQGHLVPDARGPHGAGHHRGGAPEHGLRLPRQRRDLLSRRARPGRQPDRRGEPGLVRGDDAHGLRPRQPLRHRRGPPRAWPAHRPCADRRGQAGLARRRAAHGAGRDRRPRRRGGRGAEPRAACCLDAGGGADPELRGLDRQVLLDRAAPAPLAHRHEGVRALREPLGGDERAPLHGEFTHEYAPTVAYTIYGGSSEIQRNVIATRGLGLPRG